MSTGGIGPGQVPKNVTTDVSSEKEVEPGGKTTTGASVKKEEGSILIGQGTTQTSDETKKLLEQYQVSINNDDDDGKDEDNIFFATYEDLSKSSDLDVKKLKAAALMDAGLSKPETNETLEAFNIPEIVVTPPDDEPAIPADLAEKQLKSSSKLLAKVHVLRDKVMNSFIGFVNLFRPSDKTAEVMAGGVGQLIDLSIPEGIDGDEAQKVVEEIASQLENNPSAVVESMEKKGLREVVAELKKTIRVANTKNLKKIKQTLMEHSEKYPALNGMPPKIREIMINGALIAAKIGNAGSDKTDVRELVSRGYWIGRIPSQKMQLVEAILRMNPDNAIGQLKVWHDETGTNFEEALLNAQRTVDRAEKEAAEEAALEAVPTLFEDDKLEMETRELSRGEPGEATKLLSDQNKDIQEQRRRADSKTLNNRDKLLNEISSVDRESTLSSANERHVKPKDLLPDEQKYREREAAFKSTVDEINDPRTHENFKKRNAEKAELQKVKDTYNDLVEAGGLTDTVIKQMETFQSGVAERLVQNGANPAIANEVSKAIMVMQKLAVWEDDSPNEVTYLGSTATKKDFQKAQDTALEIAGKDLSTIKEMLLNNHLVTGGPFAKNLQKLEIAAATPPRKG